MGVLLAHPTKHNPTNHIYLLKYINMGFLYFHGISVLSGKKHSTISNSCCEVMWFHLLENNTYLLFIFHLPSNHNFRKWKQQLFGILF